MSVSPKADMFWIAARIESLKVQTVGAAASAVAVAAMFDWVAAVMLILQIGNYVLCLIQTVSDCNLYSNDSKEISFLIL